MTSYLLRALAARLPVSLQSELNRHRFRWQINSGCFVPDEPEIAAITKLVSPGDTVVDVGANIGHYAVHLSRCVGPRGRVIAIEPMAETFAMLAHNVRGMNNVTLLNLAIAESDGLVAMNVPNSDTGAKNYYRAQIDDRGPHRVMSMRLDSLSLPRVRLMKIDAEGHDLGVLKSAERLIERDRPVLIVEATLDSNVAQWLRERDYAVEHAPGSPNLIAQSDVRATARRAES